VRYLTLAEAFIIAEDVTGIDAHVLVAASRSDLLDSALHAPQAGFGDTDFYPSIHSKAAVSVTASPKTTRSPTGTSDLRGSASSSFSNSMGGLSTCRMMTRSP